MDYYSVPWYEIGLRIFFAVLIGGVVGVEREYKNRPAGMRTHVLVCLGACMISLLESLLRYELSVSGASSNLAINIGRLSAQVVCGIGFLGAGTIFVTQKKIAGLTTAASLWNCACMGLLVGFGFYWVALICCAIVMIVLLLLQRMIHVNAVKHVEVKFIYRADTLQYIKDYFEKNGIKELDVDFHIESDESSPEEGHNMYTNLYTLHLPSNMTYTDIVNYLAENPHILSVRTRNS